MPPNTRRNQLRARKLTAQQPNTKDVLLVLKPHQNKECMFCSRKEICEKMYGLLYQLNDIVVHYFCILLSSRAVQNGDDSDGLLGFLYKDIKAELTRGNRELCVYCKKSGATISCCGSKCKKIFHLPCGLQNGSMHQYFQTFKSFCQQHRITQQIDLKDLQTTTPVQCSICKDDVLPTPLPSSLWAPCCKRNAWFHRQCIQQLALSAGYFFKCPLCNNVEIFKSRMLTLGIYIPSRDASWETVPNAYSELLERHNTCNAPVCLCPYPEERNHQEEAGSWEIILCNTCGSSGTHKLCSSLKCEQSWFCNLCKEVTSDPTNNTPKRRRLEITSTVTSNNVSTIPEGRSPTHNTILRRNGTRVTATRESPRLNNNREVTKTRSSNSATSTQPLVIQGDPIVISDDDSEDSDIQCVTFVEKPKPLPTPRTEIPLPIILSYGSVNGNDLNANGDFQYANTYHQLKNFRIRVTQSVTVVATIDLTLDDDEDTNV